MSLRVKSIKSKFIPSHKFEVGGGRADGHWMHKSYLNDTVWCIARKCIDLNGALMMGSQQLLWLVVLIIFS
jgi:hypothetical protein